MAHTNKHMYINVKLHTANLPKTVFFGSKFSDFLKLHLPSDLKVD